MPNTLVHIGVHGLANAPILRRGGYLPWVLLGLVAPDVPWILRRIVVHGPSVDPYLYFTVSGTLFFSCLLCLAAALFARNILAVFGVAAANCVLHLLLDAVEIKPGNYVYFFAPFSWAPFSLELIWPEHALITVLTLAGAAAALAMLLRRTRASAVEIVFTRRRAAVAAVLLAFYAAAPAFLVNGPYAADQESVKTFLEDGDRRGRTVLVDRDPVHVRSDGAVVITTFFGEQYALVGDGLPTSGVVSFSGRFVDQHTIEVTAIHENAAGFRDAAAAIGLALILAIWARDLLPVVAALRSKAARATGPP